MTQKEYFVEIARTLDAVRMPDKPVNMREIAIFIFECYEKNMAVIVAAEKLLEKFGIGKQQTN